MLNQVKKVYDNVVSIFTPKTTAPIDPFIPATRPISSVKAPNKPTEDFTSYEGLISLESLAECFTDTGMLARILQQQIWWAAIGDKNSVKNSQDASEYFGLCSYLLNTLQAPLKVTIITNPFGGRQKIEERDPIALLKSLLMEQFEQKYSIPLNADAYTEEALAGGVSKETVLRRHQTSTKQRREAAEADFNAALHRTLSAASRPAQPMFPKARILSAIEQQRKWVYGKDTVNPKTGEVENESPWNNNPAAKGAQLRLWRDALERVKGFTDEHRHTEDDSALFDKSSNF